MEDKLYMVFNKDSSNTPILEAIFNCSAKANKYKGKDEHKYIIETNSLLSYLKCYFKVAQREDIYEQRWREFMQAMYNEERLRSLFNDCA